MPRGRLYDDDDMDDGWDDYDDDYDEYDAPAQQPKAAAKAQPAAAGKKAGVAAKAAPAAAAAKKEPVVQAQQGIKYPVAPPPGFAPSGSKGPSGTAPPGFDFSTPSPDAAVMAARAKEDAGRGAAGPSGSGTAGGQPGTSSTGPTGGKPGITLAPSKAMLAANQKQLQSQQPSPASALDGAGISRGVNAGDTAGAALRGLSLDDPSTTASRTSSAATPNVAARRRMGEYRMEPGLAKECAAVAAAETSASSGLKPGLHLVVLGHVDAGKSTLMGRLLAELGVVSAKDVHRSQRDAAAAGKGSFSWAWLLDERPEERARGVTVDVATTRFATPRYTVTLLDAPGHKDFVPNMITGAAQADAALLLVDGSPGGFEAGFAGSGAAGGEFGQTREHAQLARSLGVEQVAVVVSKLDVAEWDQGRFESIRAQVGPFLTSCGFRESAVQWLPAVGPEGINLTAPPPPTCPLSCWWQGRTLVQAIDAFEPRHRTTDKPARLPVSDVFRNKTGASVVGGKLEAGALKPGSKLVVVPGGEHVTVKGLEVDGQGVDLARAGDSVEVSLTGQGLDITHIGRGFVLCHADYPAPVVTKFEARVLVLDVPIPLLKGASVTLHAHLAREAAVVSGLVAVLSPKTGEVTKAKPRCLAKGQSGLVEVTVSRGVVLEEYADLKPMGRVTLRDGGRTLAVGVVTRLIE